MLYNFIQFDFKIRKPVVLVTEFPVELQFILIFRFGFGQGSVFEEVLDIKPGVPHGIPYQDDITGIDSCDFHITFLRFQESR